MACSVLLRQPTGQRISKVRKQQFFFQFCQSYSYVNRKVWYHQIWIPNNLGFMVLILIIISICLPTAVLQSSPSHPASQSQVLPLTLHVPWPVHVVAALQTKENQLQLVRMKRFYQVNTLLFYHLKRFGLTKNLALGVKGVIVFYC